MTRPHWRIVALLEGDRGAVPDSTSPKIEITGDAEIIFARPYTRDFIGHGGGEDGSAIYQVSKVDVFVVVGESIQHLHIEKGRREQSICRVWNTPGNGEMYRSTHSIATEFDLFEQWLGEDITRILGAAQCELVEAGQTLSAGPFRQEVIESFPANYPIEHGQMEPWRPRGWLVTSCEVRVDSRSRP